MFKKKANQSEMEIHNPSLLSDSIIQFIWEGGLPVYGDPAELILADNEKCHFIDDVKLLRQKNQITGYEGGSAGVSVRIMRGVSVRSASYKGRPIRQNVTEEISGRLYITSKRLIFNSLHQSFNKTVKTITAIQTYADALAIQFGSTNYILAMPHPAIAEKVVRKVIANQ